MCNYVLQTAQCICTMIVIFRIERIVGGFEFQIRLDSLAKCLFIQIFDRVLLVLVPPPPPSNAYENKLRFLNCKRLTDRSYRNGLHYCRTGQKCVQNLLEYFILIFFYFLTHIHSYLAAVYQGMSILKFPELYTAIT